MRILHIHKYYHDHDGAGRYMFEVMRLQEASGHVVAPFAMHEERNAPSVWDKYFVSELETKKLRFGGHIFQSLARAWWSREAKQKCAAMLRAFQPDVVHVHNVYTHLSPSVLAACKQHGVPVVMTVHDYALISANYGLWNGQRPLQLSELSLLGVARTRFIKQSFIATLVLELIFRAQKFLSYYDRAIDVYLTSSKFMQNLLTQVGYNKDKIRVLPMFAANYAFKPKPVSKREGILFAGRLETYKGIDFVLQAARALPERQFYIAGTGPQLEQVKLAARQLPNLEYLGLLPSRELWQKMSEVQLVVAPSRWLEPLGLVALEAMACGTPVIIAGQGGLPEYLEPGVTSFVFNPADDRDFLATLKYALASTQPLSQMGEKARQFVDQKANPETHLVQLMEVYDAVVIHRKF
jgi:glycosyltransferase involved in cell wall biosynthesis